MISSLTASQRKYFALSLLVLVIVVLIALIVVPLWDRHRHYDRAIDDLSDQLARHQRIASAKDSTNLELAKAREKQAQLDFLKSPNPAIAASELQDLVRAAIESNGVRQIQMQVPQHKDEGKYRQVAVNVNAAANGPALRRLIHALESGRPRLLIDNLLIRQSVGSNFRPVPGSEPEMFVQFDVIAYTIGGGS